jgi:hypothetical protein
MKQETLEEAAKNYANEELSNELTSKVGNFYGFSSSFVAGAKWQQEQILDFLYSEITERRDYSTSKIWEKALEFIEQFKNK